MKLHIFNPEHDLSLAFGKDCFTPPHAARKLRSDMGYIPALWANDGDIVLVDNVEYAINASQHLKKHIADVQFLSWEDLKKMPEDKKNSLIAIEPWGWDTVVRKQLSGTGVAENLLPSPENIAAIRQLSNRNISIKLLKEIHAVISPQKIIGESRYCTSYNAIDEAMESWGKIVLKAPWSSSGRGVRYVEDKTPTPSLKGWIAHILEQQNGILAEPYYNKVKDFGMEFMAHKDGKVEYLGLSLFHTINSTYVGNLIASEEEKQSIMDRYATRTLFRQIASTLTEAMSKRIQNIYSGPFGIDMMVVEKNGEGFYIHPCVELNLRRTMGHVALSLSTSCGAPRQLMEITHNTNYQLCLTPIGNKSCQFYEK